MHHKLSRRHFAGLAGATSLGLYSGLTPWASISAAQVASPRADEVLKDLLDGNARFASGKTASPRRAPRDFALLSEAQLPEAIIIACADSRVPPEILFDHGVGDLFVVRVAGNIVNGAGAVVKGSIEYAVAELGVKLIMVLGHSNCGAVKAAVKHINDQDPLPGAIDEMVKLIQPAVRRAKQLQGDIVENAIRENVLLGVERLKSLEPIIREPVAAGRLKVVGATYDLASGKVRLVDSAKTFFHFRRLKGTATPRPSRLKDVASPVAVSTAHDLSSDITRLLNLVVSQHNSSRTTPRVSALRQPQRSTVTARNAIEKNLSITTT